MENNLILDTGIIAQEIISFIREIRSKYNIPKKKLTLYIDMLTKPVEITDMKLMKWDEIICKKNMGNLSKIEYTLFELFEENLFFETKNIHGYNVYICLPSVNKDEQISKLKDEAERLGNQIKKYEKNLSSDKFLLYAKKEVVDLEYKKLKDSKAMLQNIANNILFLECGAEYYELLINLGDNEKVQWHAQYEREQKSTNEEYSPPWFIEVYRPGLSADEIKVLYSKILFYN